MVKKKKKKRQKLCLFLLFVGFVKYYTINNFKGIVLTEQAGV